MRTIAQQLKITDFPFTVEDKDGHVIYFESSDGYWEKREFDAEGNEVYSEDSDGWCKSEFDAEGNEVYYEDSAGTIFDKRPKGKAIAKVEEARKLLKQAEKELKEVRSE